MQGETPNAVALAQDETPRVRGEPSDPSPQARAAGPDGGGRATRPRRQKGPTGRVPGGASAPPNARGSQPTAGAPASREKWGSWAEVKGATSGAPRGPARVVFARDAALRYKASAEKTGASAGRLEAHRSARSVGEFFGRHPGSAATARRDPAWDLNKGICNVSGYVARGDLKAACMGPAGAGHLASGMACAGVAAASPAGPRAPLPAAECAAEAAADSAAEHALLACFAEYEQDETDAHQEPMAGLCAAVREVRILERIDLPQGTGLQRLEAGARERSQDTARPPQLPAARAGRVADPRQRAARAGRVADRSSPDPRGSLASHRVVRRGSRRAGCLRRLAG